VAGQRRQRRRRRHGGGGEWEGDVPAFSLLATRSTSPRWHLLCTSPAPRAMLVGWAPSSCAPPLLVVLTLLLGGVEVMVVWWLRGVGVDVVVVVVVREKQLLLTGWHILCIARGLVYRLFRACIHDW